MKKRKKQKDTLRGERRPEAKVQLESVHSATVQELKMELARIVTILRSNASESHSARAMLEMYAFTEHSLFFAGLGRAYTDAANRIERLCK